jgi:nickel/cobalt transporter (NicO) family protein
MGLQLRRRLLPALAAVAALTGITVASAPAASAHPLGNFTVNYYSGIQVESHAVEIALVVDRAEIPTLQAFPDAKPGRQPEGGDDWRARQCAQLASAATLQIGGSRILLSVTSSRLELLAGAAGLATGRLECTVRTPSSLDVVGKSVTYTAATTAGRVGWHEVTARGNGTTLTGSDVPQSSVSRELTHYPQDLLTSPLDQRTARFQVRAGSGLVAAVTAAGALSSSPLRGLDSFTNAFTSLVSRTSLTPAFALLAIVLSMFLGGLHAFAPGHGKTLMAAYLVGREGTWRQAAVIGMSVTVTHTIGVLILGIALSAAVLAAPEQVYPWLGLLSGILLAGIGVTLLRSARTRNIRGPAGHTHGPSGHTHGPAGHTHKPDGYTHGPGDQTPSADDERTAADPVVTLVGASPASGGLSELMSPPPYGDGGHELEHVHDHDHEHPRHEPTHLGQHSHGHAQTAAVRRFRRGNWRLAAVGLAGGLVPSPSALLVLLGGIALGRAWFGALLVLFYGIGMAAALVGTGLLLVLARDRFERWSVLRPEPRALPGQVLALRLTRALPMLTALAVIGIGAWIAIRSLMAI